jgi:hypothetical protein
MSFFISAFPNQQFKKVYFMCLKKLRRQQVLKIIIKMNRKTMIANTSVTAINTNELEIKVFILDKNLEFNHMLFTIDILQTK